MRIWTVQTKRIYEELKVQGIVSCDALQAKGLQVEEGRYQKHYDWLADEMKKRIGSPPAGVKYPIWGWHTRNWEHKPIDLRCWGLGNKGEKLVCLELEIPPQELLLSDYDQWQLACNDFYFGEAMTQEALYKQQVYLKTLEEKEKERLIQISWERMFTVNDEIPLKQNIRFRSIQATFWQLRLDQLKHVRYFTAR